MFALVSPQVTTGELFKFLSLATPTNGLFVECQPAKDPFFAGLLRGNLGGQVDSENAARYSAFLGSIVNDGADRFEYDKSPWATLDDAITGASSTAGVCAWPRPILAFVHWTTTVLARGARLGSAWLLRHAYADHAQPGTRATPRQSLAPVRQAHQSVEPLFAAAAIDLLAKNSSHAMPPPHLLHRRWFLFVCLSSLPLLSPPPLPSLSPCLYLHHAPT